jgi:hypothetical protein
MNAIATKLQVGTAACAIAAAATLMPVAAHAAPSISFPTAPVTQVLHELNLGPMTLPSLPTIPEFSWFIFGTPNPHPPAHLTLLNLTVPILSPILVFLGLANKEICLGGATVKIGPYGGISVSLGVGC